MKTLDMVLNGQQPNVILPFLWVHGTESEEKLRAEVQKIRASSIGAFCVEARPHADFNGAGWFRDLGILLDEAKKNGMKMWLLDDSHFPTGYADGVVKREHPELCKKFLYCKSYDFAGPCKDAGALLKYALQDPNDPILAVILSPKTAFETIRLEGTQDLTDHVYTYADYNTGKPVYGPRGQQIPGAVGGLCPAVEFDLPEGEWTLNVVSVSYRGGEKETESYLNPLVSEATRVLLDTVYQPVYDHFSQEFGEAFCGFFSDEPRFGNIHGAEDAAIGHNSAMVLPWRDGLEETLAQALQGTILADKAKKNIRELLPLLFLHTETEHAHVMQYTYMNLVSRLYSENFDGELARWCHTHNCQHIGHTIEDNNATARLGYGAGHFYRAMAHQDMAGIDVVIHQLMPGMDRGMFKGMHHPGWDGEFYTYMLGKLGAGLAHLDPKKQGRCMVELFGAYGWAEGTRLCKWLADYMLVRGVNYFVPHAFNAAPFPDVDCPPHFHAGGHDPQFTEFRLLMEYMGRLSAVLSGTHIAPVALLYQAEAEWSGDFMLTQRPAGELARNAIDYEIVPCEYLTPDAAADGILTLNGQRFEALVIPYAEALPAALLYALKRYAAEGVRVYFVGGKPSRCCEGDAAELPEQVKTVPLEALVQTLTEDSLPELTLTAAAPALRYYHARQADGDVYFFTNEGTSPIRTTVHGAKTGKTFVYDAFANELYADENAFSLDLPPYASRCILVPDEPETLESVAGCAPVCGFVCEILSMQSGNVSLADAEDGCRNYGALIAFDALRPLHRLAKSPAFAGRARYSFELQLSSEQASRPAVLTLNASEGAVVRVNGKDCGTRICPPYRYPVTGRLAEGVNHIEIEVNTTLGRRMNDFLSQYILMEPQGLLGEVRLELYQPEEL